jgi:hypothetical protein
VGGIVWYVRGPDTSIEGQEGHPIYVLRRAWQAILMSRHGDATTWLSSLVRCGLAPRHGSWPSLSINGWPTYRNQNTADRGGSAQSRYLVVLGEGLVRPRYFG